MAKFAYGAGDGAITDDGCAVELYRRLEAGDEIDLIRSLAPAGGSILDLGAGAGRLADPLSAAGFVVTAVDQSADMLAEIRGGASCVRSTIEAWTSGRASTWCCCRPICSTRRRRKAGPGC